jgi:hypothetical protein
MSSTLFDAPPYDPARERRRRIWIACAIAAIIAIAALLWFNRYWPEERRVERFFAQLEAQNYQGAYAVWMNDPNWKQHPQKYARYPFDRFYQDWGPGGEWGPIHSYRIVGTVKPRSGASGVVVGVRVNGHKDLCSVWVEFSDMTLGFSPDQMVQ